MSEMRWLGFGEMAVQNGFTFLFSGATGGKITYNKALWSGNSFQKEY
jgi:hypothetical protein